MQSVMEQLQDALGADFEVVRPLGEGSFAEVFLARERALDRPVAVKVLRASLAMDETARARFLRESRLSAKIKHPNVVAVYRVGELGDGRPYLIMEYIDGRTFEDIIASAGALDEAEVRRVLTAVCGALDAAHQLGIIHRDIRPGNIMRTRSGERIVLTDFGLAGILETGGEAVTRLTGEGQILGNVRYAPPEQLTGERVEPGSDMYSLAVTAYELLTEKGPFPDAAKPAAQIKAHVSGEPTPLRRIRPNASPDLEDALLRCLQKRPTQRPSARLLARRLSGESPGVTADGAVGSFLAELKNRNVYKVGAGYGAFILVVLALVDAALPALPFDIPAWTDSAIVLTTLAGLPIALILGWFYDITESGIKRTVADEDTHRGVGALLAIGIVLALVVASLAAWFFLGR